MPQMSPLNWLFLYIFMLIILMLFILILSYLFFPNNNFLLYKKLKKNYNWMW